MHRDPPANERQELEARRASLGWPPRGPGVRGGAPTEPRRVEPAVERPRPWFATGSSIDADAPAMSAWEHFERTWLGVTRLPLRRRLLEAGWAPEAEDRRCPRCATTTGAYESSEDGCPACRGKRLPWERALRLGEYEGVLRDVVLDVKYSAWRRLGRESGRLLGALVANALHEADVARERVLLVPVPTTWRRLLTRGVDHALAIARGVRDVAGGKIERCLARTHGPAQAGLPMSRRTANVHQTMRCRRPWTGDEVVVLIDDVRTTGATLTEAARALTRGRPAGLPRPVVWTAVLCVTGAGDRRSGALAFEGGGEAGEDLAV